MNPYFISSKRTINILLARGRRWLSSYHWWWRVPAQPLALRDTLDAVLIQRAAAAHSKSLELALLVYADVADALLGNAKALRQMVGCVLDYAIRLSHHGDINMRGQLETEDSTTVTFSIQIETNGLGLPPVCVPGAWPIATEERSAELRAARHWVEKLGAAMQMESVRGGGTIFQLTLTLARDPNGSATLADANCLADSRVLLHEPHPLSATALRHRLTHWGIQVCETGAAELLILGLPASMSRFAQEAQVWEARAHHQGPLLALVSTNNPVRLAALNALGATQSLSRPVARPLLLQTLQQLLQRERSQTPSCNELPIYNSIAALEATGGNVELTTTLFQALLDDLPVQLTALRDWQQLGQQQKLGDIAHRLRGAAAYCGVPALQHAIRELEIAMQLDPADPAITAGIERLATEAQRLLAYSATRMEQISAVSRVHTRITIADNTSRKANKSNGLIN